MTPIEPDRAAPTLLAGFAASVWRYPDRIAVRAADRSLTYRELDEASDTLAIDIQANVAGPNHRIAILVERSTDLVTSAIAVLKTGSCYVPLDPAVPRARLELILDGAGPALVVTSHALRDRLPRATAVLCVDDPRTPGRLGSVPVVEPSACAYTIFTSGTTGRPKGVQISHANVLSLFAATESLFGFTDAVWSMFHSFAFDFSVWEMWGALLYGGRVVIVADAVTKDPAALRTLLRDEGVTMLSQTPTAFKVLMEEERRHPDRLALRWIVFGGEALRFPDLEPWLAKYGDEAPTLVNMYGITETTVHASYRRVTHADLGQLGSLIGLPLPDSDIHLVDRNLDPVEPGQTGEIVVVGPGVALGYLNQPALTEQRFVRLTGHDGAMVRGYRSGDLARRRDDGDLEYLGRADEQVKVRGFRIELGDVEAALTKHPAVRAAAVALRTTPPGDDAVVGYVVPAADTAPDEQHLRAYLSTVLPDYMVPVAFVTLTALPMTVNGKLDRSALPDPRGDATTTGRGPRSLREELLCQMFAAVLGRSAVGPDDDFFAMGAHSLSAVRLVNRIRAVLGLDLTIQDIFEARTVASLAARVGSGGARPALTRRPRTGEIPLSDAQRQVWLTHHRQGPIPADHMLCTVRMTGWVDVPALSSAVRDVVTRHEILRTVYPTRDGWPVARVLDADSTEPRLVVAPTSPEQRDEAVHDVAKEGFDLAADLPIRVTLLVIDPNESILAVVLHDIAVDAWSLAPLLVDLFDAYTARRQGKPPNWPPLPVQYADYVLWQRELLGELTDPDSLAGRQLAFWTEHLRGAPAGLTIPTRPSPAPVSEAGSANVAVDFDAELHARLTGLALASATTVPLVLQAAVAALLTRLGAGPDLAIGVTTTGRTDEFLPTLVGRCANTLIIRTDTSGDPSFAVLLRRVLAANLAAHDHQDLPIERLLPHLGPLRTVAGRPSVQVTVATIPPLQVRLDDPDLVVTPRRCGAAAAPSDLSFTFEERRGSDGAAQGVAGIIGYRADLFDRGTVERMGEQLVGLAQAALSGLGTSLSELDLPFGHRAVPTTTRPPTLPPDGRSWRTSAPDSVRQLVADALDVPLGQINDDFFQLLAGESSTDAVRSLLPLRTGGGREPVFCIHPSSGLCWSYVGLLEHLQADVPVYGIQSHGLLHPDQLPDTVEAMAAGYVETIRAVQPIPPYRLIGWSLGGVLAYEMAVQLQRRGAEIGLLALLDCYPRTGYDGPTPSDVEPGGRSVELADALKLVRRDLNAPASLLESRLVALLRTASHHRRLATGYVPGFFDGGLLFFQAEEDRVASGRTADGWARSISGDVVGHAVPATHMAMMDPASLARIGPTLSIALA